MNAVITSDTHIGSSYFDYGRFQKFINSLEPGCELVILGDVVDRWHIPLKGKSLEAMELLSRESLKRHVVWVRGNHDDRFMPPNPRSIDFRYTYNIGRRLFMAHGHRFENLRIYNRPFIIAVLIFHKLRIAMGGESMHVARFAKKWKLLYRILRRQVMMNAVEHARENGYSAVVCGHTHYVEEHIVDGIRYINTGSWTEEPRMVVVDGDRIELEGLNWDD